MAKKKRAKKRTRSKTTRKTAKKRGRKKKTRSGNRSQSIRDYLKTHPQAAPSKIVEVLGGKGIKVSASLVSQVKARAGNTAKPRVRRRSRKTNSRRRGRNDLVSVADLLKAKKLAFQMGGIDQAKAALDALSKLSN